MTYFENLQAMKADRMNIKLRDIGDEWRTPDPLYWGIFQLYGPFVLDLFTDGENAKCATFYTAEQNALAQPWAEQLAGKGAAFANPPYSRSSYDQDGKPTTGMRHIVAKAMAERELGARVVFLIKAAPSEAWWPEHADHICWIKGRVGFDLPDWASHLKASSAGFGQAVVVFDKHWKGERERYIARDLLEAQGQALMDAIEQRAQELAAQLAPTMGALSTEPGPIPSEPAPLSTEMPAEPEPLSTEQADDNEGPSRFTPDDLHHLWINGELKADSFPHFIAALVVMFGKQDTYTLRQLRMALVAETADGSHYIWNLTREQCEQISAFGRGLHHYQITDPGQMVGAVAELVDRRAMKDVSICEVLTQFPSPRSACSTRPCCWRCKEAA